MGGVEEGVGLHQVSRAGRFGGGVGLLSRNQVDDGSGLFGCWPFHLWFDVNGMDGVLIVTDEDAAASGMALVVVVGGRTKEAKMVGGRNRGCGRRRGPVGKSVTQGSKVVVGWLTFNGVGVVGKRLCEDGVPWGLGVVYGVYCLFGGW